MQFRFTFLLFILLLILVGCDRDDIDVVTYTPGSLPPTDSLTSTTSLAGTVKKPDGTIPANAVAEVLYGDFVIHSQRVNSGDGSWFFNDIAVSDDPNVLVRISAPGWVPAIRSIPNRNDVVRYSNVVLLDRGQTNTIFHSAEHTLSEGLLTVSIPGNSYANYEASVDLSLNSCHLDGVVNNLSDVFAAPFVIDEGGSFSIMNEPTIYAIVATGDNGERLNFNATNETGIELSTINAGPTSLVYSLNQETGYWENISTPDGLLEVKQFGYIAVAQATNSVKLTGRIEKPDGSPIPGGFLFALVTDATGSQSFDATSADGNGNYELLIPEGSSGDVVLKPQACEEKRYTITQQNTDLDLGIFSVGIGVPTLIQGVVYGCTAGVPSAEELALIVSSNSIGRVVVSVAADGSFTLAEVVCSSEEVFFTPQVRSGPSAGRLGAQVMIGAGEPLDDLTFEYCASTVTQELIYFSFGTLYAFNTNPSATQVHPDTIDIVGDSNTFWKLALSSQKVLPTFSSSSQSYSTNEYIEVDDFFFDGVELKFTFEGAEGILTDSLNRSTTSLESAGGIVVKVD